MLNLGTSNIRASSVIVPTTTTVLLALSLEDIWRLMKLMLTGGRLTRDWKRRLRTTLLNLESVRRARNRYSFTRRSRYTFFEAGALRWPLRMWCPLGRSIPCKPASLQSTAYRREGAGGERVYHCGGL